MPMFEVCRMERLPTNEKDTMKLTAAVMLFVEAESEEEVNSFIRPCKGEIVTVKKRDKVRLTHLNKALGLI